MRFLGYTIAALGFVSTFTGVVVGPEPYWTFWAFLLGMFAIVIGFMISFNNKEDLG